MKKKGKNSILEKEFSTNGVSKTGQLHIKEYQHIQLTALQRKHNSKWIKDIKVKPDRLDLTEEKVSNSLELISRE